MIRGFGLNKKAGKTSGQVYVLSYRNYIIIHVHFLTIPPLRSVQLYHFNIHLTSLSCHYQINEYKRFNQKLEGERRHLLWTLACNKYNNGFFLIRRVVLIRFQIIIYINTYDSCRGVLTHTHKGALTLAPTHSDMHANTSTHKPGMSKLVCCSCLSSVFLFLPMENLLLL